jgi:hypothetical protein
MRGLNESNYKYQTSSAAGVAGPTNRFKMRRTLRPLWSYVNQILCNLVTRGPRPSRAGEDVGS